MKNFLFTLFGVLFCAVLLKAQNNSMEFKNIPNEELTMTRYAADPNAKAVVLYDKGKSSFVLTDVSFDVMFERSTRIKILTDAGVDYAEIEIPFYHEGNNYEEVYGIEAYSYNIENGSVNATPLNLSNVYVEKIDNNWSVKKFAIPNVKKGTVIEYRYKLLSPYHFNLQDWNFQWQIPVIYSEYMVKMIPFYQYSWILQGANNFTTQNSYVDNGLSRQFGSVNFQDMVHLYVMKNVPAFYDEEFITSINDYIIKIDFQLSKIITLSGATIDVVTTWKQLIKDLINDENFGKYTKQAENLAPKLFNVEDIESKSPNEKFNFVMNFMKRNYNWTGILRGQTSVSAKQFTEIKRGSSAELNLFAVGLLNAIGIEAYPVLISTRKHGKIKFDYPYYNQFNNVLILAKVDGDSIITDATNTLAQNDRVPDFCLNDKGLIINKEDVYWLDMNLDIPSELNTTIDLTFNNNLEIEANVTLSSTEYMASDMRNEYAEDKEIVQKNLTEMNYVVNQESIAIQNFSEINLPYILSFSTKAKAEIVNDKIYISPFLNETITDNPLKRNTRTYPINMIYPEHRKYNTTILIPEGYTVDYLPSETTYSNENFDLNYSIKNDGNKITVTFEYFFKKAVYPPTEYTNLKKYFFDIIQNGSDKIVLAKIQK